ncbi:MAG: gamma carbonic anhydrase family protein [Pseudomonadota bacterium]
MIHDLGELSPDIAAGVFVADNATVIGAVTLAAGASVWFNAVLRGDVEAIVVGAGSNVQDGAILHTDPASPLRIGRGVTIGHGARLHGCTVGDYALIGINSVVLNDAVIGRHCIIGANTLVPEGRHIPDGSLVMGTPGRVVRTLSDEEIGKLEWAADHYVHNAQTYLHTLAPWSRAGDAS